MKPGLRPTRALPSGWVTTLSRAAKKAAPLPLAMLPAPAGESPFARVVRLARRGPVRRKVPVELAAAERGRVRQWPALTVNIILLVLAADLAGSIYLREAMGVKLLDQFRPNLIPPSQSVVTDQAGRRLGSFAAADAMREPIESIPTVFQDALVRWEDTRFYAHDGVDRYRMLGAVHALLQGAPQGGSTIPMQLAKLIKKDSARTLRRKLEDIALALAIDNRIGKNETLKYYANQAYFGSGVYGLGQACRYYFEREKCEGLTVEEAAYLVSLLRAPADLARDAKRAEARRDLVIDQMREPDPTLRGTKFERFARKLYLDVHKLAEHDVAGRSTLIGTYANQQLDDARKQPLELARHRDPPTHPFVLETARQELQKRLGSSIYEAGLNIRLTIDANVQAAAEKALTHGLDNLREIHRKSGKSKDIDDDLDGGVVVIDPRTGHLLAYVPGADFKTSQVPFAARPIQIGSSIKPFVYGELFEQGKGDLTTIIQDGPICIGGWCPHNYDGKYHGPVEVRFALSHSLNTVAVRIADKVGVDSIAARLRLLGVQSPITANLPMALGASEIPLIELGGIYSALYDGRAQRPKLVLDVRDRDGKVLYSGDEPFRPRVYSPSTIHMLHIAMGGIMQPGGTAAVVGRELDTYFGMPAGKHVGDIPGISPMFACKTGTHDGFMRVGLGCVLSDTDYGPVIMVAYVGNRTPRGLGEGLTGGRVAGPIIEQLVKALTVRTRAAGFFRPFDDLPNGLPPPGKPLEPEPDEGAAPEPPPSGKPVLTEAQQLAIEDSLHLRSEKDPARARFSLAHASLAGPDEVAPEQATLAIPKNAEATPPAPAEAQVLAPTPVAAAPKLSAPRDWPGLRVLDTDIVEASGNEIIKSFLEHGGREEELAELGPLLDMSVERHVIHEHRLLQPGFTDRPLSERLMQLSDKVLASLKRMMSSQQVVTKYEHPDANTHILSEADADRRIERVYRFATPPKMFRVTRHHTSGTLMALEWEDTDGSRHAMVRRGEHMAPLAARRVLVTAGSLEPAWLSAGMSPAQLDGLRALIGGSMSIDRIPRGFRLDLLLADGGLIGVEAHKPAVNKWDKEENVFAIRTESACLSQDGIPCGRHFMPLPLAEARFYGKRAAGDDGEVLIQRDLPGSIASVPVTGHVIVADSERDQVVVHADDGHVLQFDGVSPSVDVGDNLLVGSSLGRLDPRGVLVYHATETLPDGRQDYMEATESLPDLGGADESLRAVSAWWRDLHSWLRGEKPALRHPVAVQPS